MVGDDAKRARSRASSARSRLKHRDRLAVERRAKFAAETPAEKKARAAYNHARRIMNRSIVDRVKSVPCADCGGTFPTVCMDLDHRPGENKVDAVAKMILLSPDRILAEIAKCDVVCANCHRIRTQNRMTGDA